jgi:hypothetical protein
MRMVATKRVRQNTPDRRRHALDFQTTALLAFARSLPAQLAGSAAVFSGPHMHAAKSLCSRS